MFNSFTIPLGNGCIYVALKAKMTSFWRHSQHTFSFSEKKLECKSKGDDEHKILNAGKIVK